MFIGRSGAGANFPPDAENVLALSEREQNYLDSRVLDLEKAGTRSRWIYGSTLAVSLMLFSVAFNEYYSWYRDIALNLRPEYVAQGWGDQLRSLVMKEWIESLQFDLPFVGGRFGASDAGIIGGVSLLLISYWCFYAAKRENHILYFIIKDAEEMGFSDAAKSYLRHHIAATQVFVSGHSKAYSAIDLDSKSIERTTVERKNWWNRIKNMLKDVMSRATKIPLFSSIYSFFVREDVARFIYFWRAFITLSPIFMSPFLSLLFVFYVDLKTLSEPSPIRKEYPTTEVLEKIMEGVEPEDAPPDKVQLVRIVCELDQEPEQIFRFFDAPVYDLRQCNDGGRLAWRLALSFLFGVWVSYRMFRAYRFQAGIQEMIRRTRGWSKPIVEKRKQILAKEKHQKEKIEELMRLAACSVSVMMAKESNKSLYLQDQVWTFRARPGEERATLLINRVESDPKLGEIFHISVFGVRLENPMAPGGVTTELPHFPVSRVTLDKSCLELQGTRAPNPDYLDGYAEWRGAFDAGKAGVFDIPVSGIVDIVQQAIAQHAAR